MKIGILTLPPYVNYGGILQTYALQTVLERMGHEVVVLYSHRNEKMGVPPILIRLLIYIKRFLKRMFCRYDGLILYSSIQKNHSYKTRFLRTFINKYIHRSILRNIDEANNLNLDAIVVGSDQVWRSIYFRLSWFSDMSAAFCGFCTKPVIRVAYAASFGIDEWDFTDQETDACRELIKKFTMVSTREVTGVDLCRKYLGYDCCQHVLDPTMLLEREDYVKLADSAGISHSEGILLCYILDETDYKRSAICDVASKWGLKPLDVNFQDKGPLQKLPKDGGYPPIEKWLRGFEDAEMVITDSFHACVFSILFNKPFIVFGNAERGMTRFNSLLSTFGLEKCLIADSGNFEIPVVEYDWGSVNKVLANRKVECWQLLNKAIAGGKRL